MVETRGGAELPRFEASFSDVPPIEVLDKPHENCAVFGIYLKPEFAQTIDIRKVQYNVLQALQHRGEEGSGMVVSDGFGLYIAKGVGRVVSAFYRKGTEAGKLDSKLPENSHIGIGHNRYGTTKAKDKEANLRRVGPMIEHDVAVAHNGQVNNTLELCSEYDIDPETIVSDTDVMTKVIQIEIGRQENVEEAIKIACRKFDGAYALTILTKDKLIGVCDPHGFRPLELARIPGKGYVLSSETCALNMAQAEFIRSITPGEMVVIDSHGQRSQEVFPREETTKKRCILEAVYFARPDSTYDYWSDGSEDIHVRRSFKKARNAMGQLLAKQLLTKADVVVPVPESGRHAAEGFSAASGIPLDSDITKNGFIGRTFIQPSQDIRKDSVNLKLNPIEDEIYNKDLVIVDDSIVRGTTMRRLVGQLRDAGARQVHLRISSPPIEWPCFYGIDFPTPEELLAFDRLVNEMCLELGADSLVFLSLENLHQAVSGNIPEDQREYCDACMTGDYPTETPLDLKPYRKRRGQRLAQMVLDDRQS